MRRRLSMENLESRELMSATPISVEAESMAIISGSWRQVSDTGASGRKSMVPTRDNVGELRKDFSVSETGTYSVTFLFKAPDLKANSFAYSIDNGPVHEVDLPKTSGYKSIMVPLRETLAAGNHTLHVYAREDGTRIDRCDFRLETVTPPDTNHAPTAQAGVDQAKTGTLNTTLFGQVGDVDGNVLTSAWTKVSGPGTVTFTNAASPSTGATFSDYGIYVLRLSVTDGKLGASDDITIKLDKASTGGMTEIHSQYMVTNPANGSVIDLSGKIIFGDQNNYGLNYPWPDPVTMGHKSQTDHNAYPSVSNAYPLSIKGESSYTLQNGTVVGELDPMAPWHVWKNIADGDAIRAEGLGQVTVQGMRVDNVEDGFAPRTADDSKRDKVHFTIQDSYFTRVHDDMVENDSTENLTIQNSFMAGHTFYSSRGTPNPAANILIKNMVVELKLQPHQGRISGSTLQLNINEAGGYPYDDGLGCGQLFKLDGGGKDGTIRVEDSVFLVPRASTSSMDAMRLDQTGLSFKNVTVVWLGEGAYPGTVPAGVTITRDISAFTAAKASFFAQHPQFNEGVLI